jgi:hypothetical protein
MLLIVLVGAVVSSGYLHLPSDGANAAQGKDELRIELTGSGFVPAAVEHGSGTFAIAIENSTLSGEYTLRLKAEDGTLLKEISVQKGSSAWSVSLAAGHYTITESNNPNWVCSLTVQ